VVSVTWETRQMRSVQGVSTQVLRSVARAVGVMPRTRIHAMRASDLRTAIAAVVAEMRPEDLARLVEAAPWQEKVRAVLVALVEERAAQLADTANSNGPPLDPDAPVVASPQAVAALWAATLAVGNPATCPPGGDVLLVREL